jgi:hypothetical protein
MQKPFLGALARVEVVRAVRPHGAAAMTRARRLLRRRLDMLQLDDELLDAAAALDGGILRSLDAGHLASAQALGDEITAMVTCDDRIRLRSGQRAGAQAGTHHQRGGARHPAGVPRAWTCASGCRYRRSGSTIRQRQPLHELVGGFIRSATVERHHCGGASGAAAQLRAPSIADGGHLDFIGAPANGFFVAMHCHDVLE